MKKIILLTTLLSIFFVISYSYAQVEEAATPEVIKDSQLKRYIDGLNNINKVFALEDENMLKVLERIPVEYLEYLRLGMRAYNEESSRAIEQLNREESVKNIGDLFIKYKELRRVSNILNSYNNLSEAIELNYKIINTSIVYLKKSSDKEEIGEINELIESLAEQKSLLHELVYTLEKSLSQITSISLEVSKPNTTAVNSMRDEYYENRAIYEKISEEILGNVDSTLKLLELKDQFNDVIKEE